MKFEWTKGKGLLGLGRKIDLVAVREQGVEVGGGEKRSIAGAYFTGIRLYRECMYPVPDLPLRRLTTELVRLYFHMAPHDQELCSTASICDQAHWKFSQTHRSTFASLAY